MAGFKTAAQYQEERYSGMFMLRNDGDSKDVIFMYRDMDDVLLTDAHYIKSENFSGYVHCIGRGCPACNYGDRGIRVQGKLFIPVYVIDDNEILFWDRNARFLQQLENAVFSKFPNPSEFVFRITRHGAAGDINTTYEITAIASNKSLKYQDILNNLKLSLPEYYETVCKTWSAADYNNHLNPVSTNSSLDVDTMPEYKMSPRAGVSQVSVPDLPELPDLEDLDTAEASSSSVTSSTSVEDMEPVDESEVNF